MTLQGHTILVTGAAAGIGRGLAELLARLGNEVLVVGAGSDSLGGVELDLHDPWQVAHFAEQVVATRPALNMLVNIAIAFPVRHLPGLDALLADDDTPERLQAQRLGVQQLTGALLPHLRKRPQGSVMSLSVGPLLAPLEGHFASQPVLPVRAEASQGCVMSVRKRWSVAAIEVVDVAAARPMAPPPPRGGLPRAEFIARVAHLLAEGLHEAAALARLRLLWPSTRTSAASAEQDDVAPALH